MLAIIKSIFVFKYVSPLSLDTCAERLTGKYKRTLIESGVLPQYVFLGWTIIFEKPKNCTARICSTWGSLWLYYNLTLTEEDNNTILHCRHNPFGFFGLLVPSCLTFFCLVTLIVGAILDRNNGVALVNTAILFMGAFSALIALEGFGRAAVTRYLERFLDAKPAK
ncbi:MAG: hypothetical protein LBG97_05740 [Coriobacteriales bacterium]|jgi:hypothetical protein|nr:hypothetical protein [Coriobacteriales bacterium]